MRLYKGIPLKTCANDFLRILNHTGWGLEVFVRVLTFFTPTLREGEYNSVD